jgi:probable rRNA maturation factor
MNESKATAASPTDACRQQADGLPPGEQPGKTAGKTERRIHDKSKQTALHVLVADQQSILEIDRSQLQVAIDSVFRASLYDSGTISIAVVDDPTIHEINRQYLEHDYPTDVLSFVLEDRPPFLDGELVVSTDTAARNAADYGWPASSELLLYVIHGALHLVGHRDKQADETAAMRAAEARHLRELGIALPNDASRWSAVARPTVPDATSVQTPGNRADDAPVGESAGESRSS